MATENGNTQQPSGENIPINEIAPRVVPFWQVAVLVIVAVLVGITLSQENLLPFLPHDSNFRKCADISESDIEFIKDAVKNLDEATKATRKDVDKLLDNARIVGKPLNDKNRVDLMTALAPTLAAVYNTQTEQTKAVNAAIQLARSCEASTKQ